MIAAKSSGAAQAWAFFRAGGVNQVVLRTGDEIGRLEALDLKLWMALAMPTRGVEVDPQTADLLDTDKDGRIRPPEVLAAVRWAREAFADLGLLAQPGSSVPLSAIRRPELLAAARRILADLGKPQAEAISLEDVASKAQLYALMKFNGDGIVPADAAGDEPTRRALEDILGTLGPETDLGGRPGVSRAKADAFFAQAEALVAWADHAESDAGFSGLDLAGITAAREAAAAVKVKADDYFVRCRLAAYDERALGALNREASDYAALAAGDLTLDAAGLAALPIARAVPGGALPLDGAVNPAWAAAVQALRRQAVAPLLGDREALAESDWAALQAKLAPFEAWQASRPETPVAALGVPRLRELLQGGAREAVGALIDRDLAVAGETAQLDGVQKLVRFRRDLYEVLTNYVNFADFYGRTGAVFQAGTLYLDARACTLCIEVADIEKHAALAGRSGAFLAYCQLTRPGGRKKSIAAVITDGDSENLMAGRNGVFYDRQGLDWDASIVKIVSNPISVREAFWLPYKKFIRFIEEQVAKRAQAGEAASMDKLSAVATTAVAPPAAAPAQPAAAAAGKKLDLGTIALIGTAVGGISALVGGFLQALFGLGFWLPLGLLGIILLISGPSMILAWLKLRARNLGPILDANGWAINTRAKMNVPFGAALTHLARLPPGATRVLADPYAARRAPRPVFLVLLAAALLAAAILWARGWFEPLRPASRVSPQPPAGSPAF